MNAGQNPVLGVARAVVEAVHAAQSPKGRRVGPLFESCAIEERTLPKLLERGASRYPDKVFVSAVGGEIRFGELPLRAGSVAAGLKAHGVSRGDRVALMTSNRLEGILTEFGCAWLGAVFVPISPDLRGRLLWTRLEHCQPTALIADASATANLPDNLAALSNLRAVVRLDPEPPTPLEGLGAVADISWPQLVSRPGIAHANPAFDDALMIAYTSGTTGASKGVVVTHHHAYCSAVPYADGLGIEPHDVLWTCLPLYHVGARYHALLPALAAGAGAVIRSKFSASGFWTDMGRSGATCVHSVAMMANVLLEAPASPGDRDHAVQVVSCFPAPRDPRGFEERFGVQLLTQNWGMTEVYPNPPSRRPLSSAPSCVGKPIDLYDVRVVDESGGVVPKDGRTAGEVVVRARLPAAMTSGYYRDTSATRRRIRDGWFYTGDLMSWDEDSLLYFVGRNKDMIRRRGQNVSAFELEAESLHIPGIAQAAAYGVPSPLGDEDIKLDAVLMQGTAMTVQELVASLAETLPRYMLPRYVQFRKALPTGPAGKIEKFKLVAEGIGPDAVEVTPPDRLPAGEARAKPTEATCPPA